MVNDFRILWEVHMRRRVVSAAAATVLAAGALVGAAAPAQAAACRMGWECVTTYYEDSAHTTVVGGKVEFCEGGSNSWGTRTGYFDYERYQC
jgi:hypothetical protein